MTNLEENIVEITGNIYCRPEVEMDKFFALNPDSKAVYETIVEAAHAFTEEEGPLRGLRSGLWIECMTEYSNLLVAVIHKGIDKRELKELARRCIENYA